MRTSTKDRLTAATAEQLLDGGAGPADLRQLLDAAAGPGTSKELAGEAAALAAFVDAPRASSLPSAPSRRPSMLSTFISKIVAAKVGVAVVALAGATYGVALAATAADGPEAPPAATQTAVPPADAGQQYGKQAGVTEPESDLGPGADPASPADPDPSLMGLCNAWAAGATDNRGAAAGNPAYGALVDAAGSPEAVDGYCADMEDSAAEGRPDRPPAPSGDAPGASENRGTPPTAAPGNPNRPAGPPADAPRPNERANERATDANDNAGPNANANANDGPNENANDNANDNGGQNDGPNPNSSSSEPNGNGQGNSGDGRGNDN